MILPILVDPQATVRATLGEEIAASQAVAAFELAWWKKNHPKADLALTINDPGATTSIVNLIRKRLGYPNPIPVLDPHVLTIILDPPTRSTPKLLTMEGFVFLGSFPKGFQARYVIRMDGKVPAVTRKVLANYEMIKPSPTTVASPKT